MAPEEARVPEVVASCRQNDAVRGKALVLHQEGDVTVELSRHQRAELLRQQLRVIDLRRGAAAVAAHRRCRIPTLADLLQTRCCSTLAIFWSGTDARDPDVVVCLAQRALAAGIDKTSSSLVFKPLILIIFQL